jgi:hypothetical protein
MKSDAISAIAALAPNAPGAFYTPLAFERKAVTSLALRPRSPRRCRALESCNPFPETLK